MSADSWLQDLRYGARNLIRRPAFSLVVILALGLGIGANTAILRVVDAVLLEPLPYGTPDRLVGVFEQHDRAEAPRFGNFTYAAFLDLGEESDTFADIGGYRDWLFNLTGDGDPERLSGALVSPRLLPLLQVPPAHGRLFRPEECSINAPGVVVVGHDLWQRRWGGDPGLVGRQVRINDSEVTVIGIMPPGFAFPEDVQLWQPLPLDSRLRENRTAHLVSVVGRLRPGATVAQAEAEMASFAAAQAREYPGVDPDLSVPVVGLQERLVEPVRRPLWLLTGAVAFVLLIACANVANLVLAHASGREGELSLRAALGADRWRLARQLLTESALLGLAGGALGTWIAYGGVQALLAIAPTGLPRLDHVTPGWGLPLVAAGLSMATVVLFGSLPAIQASRPNLSRALRAADARGSSGTHQGRTRQALVVVEVALALILLVGSGLLLNSFLRLLGEDTGFRTDNVLAMQLWLSPTRYGEGDRAAERQAQTLEDMLSRMRDVPGVRAASLVNVAPLAGGPATGFHRTDQPPADDSRSPLAEIRAVDPAYFETMGIPLSRGRGFTRDDKAGAPDVMIVSEALARRYFPDEDPLGKHITMTGWGPPRTGEIVGIVGDVKIHAVAGEFRPTIYWPYRQFPQVFVTFVAHTSVEPESVAAALKSAVWQVDPEQPVSAMRTMREAVAGSIERERFLALLLAVFSGIALVLSAIGLYGVISYSVAQRTREIGVRLALGARSRDVLRMVLGQGLRLALIGLGTGLVGALALSRLLTGLLHDVQPNDPLTFATVSLLLLLVALGACLIPARRATRVDPIDSLRA